ncbi:ubiquitin conjugation factor e4, putative, partial [Ichthyophthirius multifiliis]
YYKEQYSQYNKMLVEIVKQLLKKSPLYNYQQDMLRYVAACIVGNKDRAKLGNRLQQQNKNIKKNSASDAFMLNLFDVMLEIAKVIFNKNEDKWLKVLPEYFLNSSRLKHLQEQSLYNEKLELENQKGVMEVENQEFGTITVVFFLCQQLGHFGLIPIYDNFKDNAEQLQRLEKQFKRMDQNNFQSSKLVESLYNFYNTDKDRMHKIIMSSIYAQRNIIPALVKFYIDIEFASDNMFYSKFNYRHCVNYLFSKLWEEKIYQEEIYKIINNNPDLFERFINMVINDCNYCTDEGITNLKQIYDYYKKGDPSKLSQEEQQSLDRCINMAKIFNQQSKETINLIANMSNWAPNSFLSDTFLELIVTMLYNFLMKIMDPSLNQYNQKDYSFSPNTMLRDLVTIYANLSFSNQFINKITLTHSFDIELFDRTLKKAKKDQLTPYDIQEVFLQFLNQLNIQQKQVSQPKNMDEGDITDEQLEDAFQGEIPDEFLCALTFSLLKDPVQLPSSGQLVERSIIKKALLDNEIDPFNRQKLKRDQLVEVPEL